MYKSHSDRFKSKVQHAFHNTADRFGGEMTKAIDSKIYHWGNRTRRKSGELVYTPRNIVDTGNLRNRRIDISSIDRREYIYLADYASDVLNGYIDEYGNPKPPRNWVRVAVNSHDWAAVFGEEY
jgi:hypothetical protein